MCVSLCVCVHVSVCACTCSHAYVRVDTYLCVCVRACVCVHAYVCVGVCMHLNTQEIKTYSCFLLLRGQRLDSERHRRQLDELLHRDDSQKVGGLVTQANNTSDVEDEALELLGEWFSSYLFTTFCSQNLYP